MFRRWLFVVVAVIAWLAVAGYFWRGSLCGRSAPQPITFEGKPGITEKAGEPPGEKNQLLAAIARTWSARDPAAAAAWVATFPEGAVRQKIIGDVAGHWAQSDAPAAAQWLTTLPAGDSRDIAIYMYIQASGAAQPMTASIWAQRISDRSLRELDSGALTRK